MRLNRNVCRNAVLFRRTNDLDDFAGRLLNRRRVIENSCNDDLPGLCPARFTLTDQNTVRDFRIVRHDDANAPLANKAPDSVAGAALEHIDDLTLGAAASIVANDLQRNTVAIEDGTHLACGQIDIGIAIIARDEAKAVAMTSDFARDKFEFFDEAILAAAVLDDLAGRNHAVQSIRQQIAYALALQLESRKYFFFFHRFTGLFEKINYLVPARDRMLVGLFSALFFVSRQGDGFPLTACARFEYSAPPADIALMRDCTRIAQPRWRNW